MWQERGCNDSQFESGLLADRLTPIQGRAHKRIQRHVIQFCIPMRVAAACVLENPWPWDVVPKDNKHIIWEAHQTGEAATGDATSGEVAPDIVGDKAGEEGADADAIDSARREWRLGSAQAAIAATSHLSSATAWGGANPAIMFFLTSSLI